MAILGQGTTLGHSTTSGGTYVSLAECFMVTTPKVDTAQVKTTHYGTTNLFHTYISGFKEGGEVTFECNYNKTEYATLDGLQGTALYWKITLPDGSTSVFPGDLKDLEIAIPNEDKMTHKGTIKVTGAPVFTAGV